MEGETITRCILLVGTTFRRSSPRSMDWGWAATFRLPSEAEWEYACRAGTHTRFFFGNWRPYDDWYTDGPAGSLPGNRSDYMWWLFNQSENTNSQHGRGVHPVGAKRPNQWGLCDMIGNVDERCQDYLHHDHLGAPTDGSPWMEPDIGINRIFREALGTNTRVCTSFARAQPGTPNYGYKEVGFRLVWTAN